MNVILVSDKAGKGVHSCLSHRHLTLILLVGLLGLPLLIGTLTYKIEALLERANGNPAAVHKLSVELKAQRREIEAAKVASATHLNALALKLGQLQAQTLRLNALGTRLTRMAGLDQREFNFAQDVAQGGPEAPSKGNKPDIAIALDRLTNEIQTSEARLKALETLLLDRRLSDAVTPAGFPTEGGFVSSGFGHRVDPFTGANAYHEGVDIASRLGSPIRAMADGVVSFVGDKTAYGKTVEITHGRGITTRYAHTLATLVKVGDKVSRGDAIAQVGSSGRSTGPHVHVEVLRDGRQVNPLGYLHLTAR